MSRINDTGSLGGVGGVIAFQLRRDRWWLPAWVLSNTLVTFVLVNAVKSSYATTEAIAGYSSAMGASPASRMMSGRQAALDTLGGITVSEATVISVIMVSLMALFTVMRHTRGDEEAGRTDLLRSTAVGPQAIPSAAITVSVLASLVTGALNSLVFVNGGLPLAGSIGFGAGLGLTGVVFTASSAVAGQIAASARGALGLGGSFIGAMFIIRGIAAVSDSCWGWLTPFRVAQEVRPFGNERWWPLGILLAAATVGFVLTATLSSRRDLGAGLRPPRPGPAHARGALGTPIGLAIHEQRGLAVGWLAGLAAAAALFGAITTDITASLESNPDLAEFLLASSGSGDLSDGFATFSFQILAILLTVFATAAALRLRSGESQGFAEVVLATATSRTRWVAATLAATAISTVLISIGIGLSFGATYAAVDGDGSHVAASILTALSQMPAVLVMPATALAIWAWTRSALGWLLLAFAIAPTFLGEVLKLPEWMSAISPFWHTPSFPATGSTPSIAGLAVLAGVAGSFGIIGVIGINRRDIVST